jgi:hypothetical protein
MSILTSRCPGQRSSIGGSPSSQLHSLSSMKWVDQPAGACGASNQRIDLRVLRTSTPQVANRSTTANTPRISQ